MVIIRKKAFTLVELLVVISIIALLLSILMPSLGKARKLAGGVVCMTNLKQISLGYMLYQNDHGRLPEYGNNSYYSGNIHWAGALRGYYEDVEAIRLCPLAKKANPLANSSISGTGNKIGDTFNAWSFDASGSLGFEFGKGETSGLGSYGENCWIRKPGDFSTSAEKEVWASKSWGTTGVSGSNRVPLIFDSRWVTLGVGDNDSIPPKSRADSLYPYCISAGMYQVQSAGMRRHKQGVNMFFLDNSGRNIDVDDLWDLKWTKTYKPKGRQDMGWVQQ